MKFPKKKEEKRTKNKIRNKRIKVQSANQHF